MSDNQDKFYTKFYALFDQLNEYRDNRDSFMNVLSTIKQLLKFYINSSDSQTDVFKSMLVTLEQHLTNNVLSDRVILDNISSYIFYSKKVRHDNSKRAVGPIKPGVDFVFEKNPELADIGTKEQYSLYLDTIFPESKIKDIFYHGTLIPFESFENNSHFGTYNAAQERLHSVSGGIESLKRSAGRIIPVVLNIKNPYNEVDHSTAWQQYIDALPKEFDGLIYRNAYEDRGSVSYCVFKPEQIHILGSEQDIEGFKKFIARS